MVLLTLTLLLCLASAAETITDSALARSCYLSGKTACVNEHFNYGVCCDYTEGSTSLTECKNKY